MHQTDFQIRTPVEHPSENQLARRQGGVHRITQEVAEIVIFHPLGFRRNVGMNEDWNIQRLRFFKEGKKSFFIEAESVDIGSDANSAEPQALDRVSEFRDGGSRFLQGHRSQSRQPAGV